MLVKWEDGEVRKVGIIAVVRRMEGKGGCK